MSDVMIEVDGLTKDYGPTRAVDHVSFSVRRGEVLGFLGPNGAGKSTTMKILTCFLSPTAVARRWPVTTCSTSRWRCGERIGYLPEDTPIYRDMTVLEFLEFAAAMRGMDPPGGAGADQGGRPALRPRRRGRQAGRRAVQGFRQRVGLAQAMLHDPDILILDEPTSGLDPNQIVEIRSLIKEIGREKTVILSTHILPEVQATCSRILIISGGKLVADGTPDSLRAREKRRPLPGGRRVERRAQGGDPRPAGGPHRAWPAAR